MLPWLVAVASVAHAGGDNYLNISFTGDGKTPSALELFDTARQELANPAFGVTTSNTGDAGWSLPLELPPALLMPTVGVSYSSGRGYGRLGRGFAIDVGLEIHRPRGPLASEYVDDPGVLVVSGAAHGLLVPDGAGYKWVSEQPGRLVAIYDPAARAFTIRAGRRTAVVTAPDGDGEPTWWRTTSESDLDGNRVDYHWTGDRIDTVTYGGTDAEEGFLEVAFGYEDTAHGGVRADNGVLFDLEERLVDIVISSSHGHDTLVPRVRYVFTRDESDELVTAIDQVDVSSGAVRTVAGFAWTALADASEVQLDAPSALVRFLSSVDASGNALSNVETQLFDASGDGLPDVVDDLGSAGWARLDRADGSPGRWWETPERSLGTGGLGATVGRILYETADDEVDGTYTTVLLADLDGDGRLDRIASPAVPIGYDEGLNPDCAAINLAPVPTTWTVTYGSDGTFAGETLELGPVKFPTAGSRPKIPATADGFHPETVAFEGDLVDLVDVDSDGWLDVVTVEPGLGLFVYHRVPERGAGWELDPVFALSGTMGSLSASLGFTVPDAVSPTWSALDSSLETPVIVEFLDIRSGLYDVNADGAVDWVDAGSWTAASPRWQVYLGTGAGLSLTPVTWDAPTPWISRSDEGAPNVDVCSIEEVPPPDPPTPEDEDPMPDATGGQLPDPPPPIEDEPTDPCTHALGRSQAQIGGLLDVDGDGRPDLVVGETSSWARNLGDGFGAPQTLAGWYPRETVGVSEPHESVVLSLSTTDQTVVVTPGPVDPQSPADDPVSGASHTQYLAVLDVDRDGLPDVVDRRGNGQVIYGGRLVDGDGVVRAGGVRPGLLERVTSGFGAITTVTYASSAASVPSGEDLPSHRTRARADLVAQIEVEDPITGFVALHTQRWSYGDGSAHRLWGFLGASYGTYVWEPDLATGAPPTAWAWKGGGSVTSDVSRDHVLPVREIVTADKAIAYAGGGFPDSELRAVVDTSYDDNGWATHRAVTEWSDPRVGAATSRMFEVDVTRDDVGNPLTVTHTAPNRPEDKVETRTTWVTDPTGTFDVPISRETWAVDPLHPDLFLVNERGDWGYDGGAVGAPPTVGRVTTERVCSGLAGFPLCGEQLDWELDYSARGALVTALAPGGREWYADALDYGDATVAAEQNALGHATHRSVDDLGRVDETIDANGVKQRTTYDAFGRAVWVEKVGGGGPLGGIPSWQPVPVAATEYFDGALPRWSRTDTFTSDTFGSDAGVYATYTVYDGFGRPVQTWTQRHGGPGFVVRESERDPSGLERRVFRPHHESVFTDDYPASRGTELDAYSYYDVYGEAVLSWTATGGTSASEWSAPGTRRTVDALLDTEEHEHDTLGRLIEVRQGQGAVLSTTGSYVYDGRGRIVSFTDGVGNVYRYDIDGAGRIRQVWRRDSTSATDQASVAYTWDGPDPVGMYRGTVATGQLRASWTYDALGRTLTKDVLDGVSGGSQHTAWTWDTRWVGALSQTTDPAGSTTYTYEIALGVGGFGWPSDVVRTTTGVAAAFRSTYDAQGRVVEQEWPSGAVVSTTYAPQGAVAAQELIWGTESASVSYAYDAVDRPTGWDLSYAGSTWSQDTLRYPTGQLLSTSWTESAGNGDHSLRYGYDTVGRLSTKTVDALEPFTYTYDAYNRASGMFQNATGLEVYTYDTANNPLTMQRAGESRWDYLPTTRFNEVPSRSRPVAGGRILESWAYDASGQMTSWTTDDPNAAKDVQRTFWYDGAGRLQKAKHIGLPASETAEYSYDVADKLVLEKRTPTGQPVRQVRRFQGWISDNGVITESVLPMARLDAGKLRIVYLEPDGHAHWTVGGTAAVADTTEFVGVYGVELPTFAVAPDWNHDGFHATEPDRAQEIMPFGVRHVLALDGRWMQPEPMLYAGLTAGDIAHPLNFGGLYAAGNPLTLTDPSGLGPVVWMIQAMEFTGKDAADLTFEDLVVTQVGLWAESVSAPANAPDADDVPLRATGWESIAMAATLVDASELVPARQIAGKAVQGLRNAVDGGFTLNFGTRGQQLPLPLLPSFDGKTTGLLVPLDPPGPPIPLTSGSRTGARFPMSQADGHVETLAALAMNENKIRQGIVYHNNPKGTCKNCTNYLPFFLDEGSELMVVPPTNAVAPSASWADTPTLHVGNDLSAYP